MKIYLLALGLLCSFAGSGFAREPLTPDNYRGAWQATFGGVRTGGDIQVSIAKNGMAVLYYFTINEITGDVKTHVIDGRVVSRKVIRGSNRFYAISQAEGYSVRGWYRLGNSPRLIRFYADHTGAFVE